MNDLITETDSAAMQAELLAEGYELQGAMADPARFAVVLNQMLADIKDELVKFPEFFLFSHGTGNFMSEYERAERVCTAEWARKNRYGDL